MLILTIVIEIFFRRSTVFNEIDFYNRAWRRFLKLRTNLKKKNLTVITSCDQARKYHTVPSISSQESTALYASI